MTQEAIRRRNNVRIFGKGTKTIIFAHGFGCDQQVWHKITPAFEEEFQIVVFDYVGSGHSDKSAYNSERYGTPEGYAADIVDICIAFNLKDIIFVGHSISGVIGLLASITNAALFDKLCLIGPSPCYINQPGYAGGFDKADIDELLEMMERNYKEWVKYLAPIASKNSGRPALTEEFEEILMANDQHIVRQFCEMTFNIDVRDDLEKVKIPSVILQAKEDSIVPLEIAHYLHTHLHNSKLILMEATGHNPHLSYPEETIYHIKNFIGGQ
ncbi:alpha/beta hydrolase [Sporosarcina sp. YIM B06819]|uniref:alpha/beta fold hydrolase n=1 Tax=Sporosarcina sp. YIM B06819 TaxID=3081769 RepID=UPI00298D2D28|nr:alpha/beta hydrolase [Sporosarcina sp. YIM B06819]